MIKETLEILKKFKTLFGKSKKYIIIIFILSILMTLISIFSPALVSKMIYYNITLEYKKVFVVLFIIGSIKILNLLFSLLSNKLYYKVRKDFLSALKSKISQSILNFDLSTFSLNGKGKYLQRINNDPENIANNLEELKTSLMILLTNFGVLFLVSYLNIYIGITYFVFTFTILSVKYFGIKRKITYKRTVYEEQEKINEEMTEVFNGIKDVKQLNMKTVINKKNSASFNRIEDLHSNADYLYSLFDKLSLVFEWLGTFIVLLLSMYFYKNGNIQVDGLLSIFMYKRYVFSFSDSVAIFLNKLSEFNLSCNRILEIVSFEEQKEKSKEVKKCLGKIEFKDLTFSYNREEVLKKCSFTINENEKVLIVGESGSGKTTILNLITKIYNVEDGSLFIDDEDINTLSEEYIRKNVAVISQYYYLFDLSIKDNFCLVKPNMTDEEMFEACQNVGIHDFIMSLPDQYNTIVGTGGYSLSGGQRQRIAIARALLLNSKIILFDEVTSSLDTNLENLFVDLINKLEGKHTIIVVSHNSRIYPLFDKIMVVHNNKIENIGNHKYLLKNSSEYKKLYSNK